MIRRRAKRFAFAVLTAAVLASAILLIPRVSAQAQGRSTRIDGLPVVTVNVADLARQNALRPRVTGTIAYAAPEPGEYEEPEAPRGAEPPNRMAVVDAPPLGVSSPAAVLTYDGEIDQAKGGGASGP